jgi:hypothetical protein
MVQSRGPDEISIRVSGNSEVSNGANRSVGNRSLNVKKLAGIHGRFPNPTWKLLERLSDGFFDQTYHVNE